MEVQSPQIFQEHDNSPAGRNSPNGSTPSAGSQSHGSGSLDDTRGGDSIVNSNPVYLSPYPSQRGILQQAILLHDPRFFYSTHDSNLPFPAPGTQAARSSDPVLTQLNIRNWFLDPAHSGLKRYMNASVYARQYWQELGALLVSVTGLSRESIMSVMLVLCTCTLDPFKPRHRARFVEKWAIGSRARNTILERMSVPWSRDTACRLWLDVALGLYATFAVDQWKKRIASAKKRNKNYTINRINETVSTVEGTWIVADLQVPAQSPPYVHEAVQDDWPSWKDLNPKQKVKRTSTTVTLVLKNKEPGNNNESEEVDAMDLDAESDNESASESGSEMEE